MSDLSSENVSGIVVDMVAKKAATQAKKSTQQNSQKVDFYPNRMTFAVSALAGTTLIFIGLIAVTG